MIFVTFDKDQLDRIIETLDAAHSIEFNDTSDLSKEFKLARSDFFV